MIRYLVSSGLLGLLFAFTPASADIVNVSFTGEIFRVGSDLGTQVQSGDAYTLTVTYDSEAPLESFVPDSGSYPAISMELEITTSTGPLRTVSDSPRIELQSQPTYQRITFTQAGVIDSFELNGRASFNPQLTMFSDQNPLPHNGLELPTTFDRSDYSSSSSSSQLSLAFGNGLATELIKGTIDAISGSPSGPPEPTLPTALAGAVALDQGWYYNSWFKSFRPLGDNWIYHPRLGFLYTLGDDANSVFLWDQVLNRWLWTSASQYPWMYAFGPEGGWVFFFENGQPGSRFFARGDTGEVIFENQLRLDPPTTQ